MKIVIAAVKKGYCIVYNDVFTYTTPRLLAEFITGSANQTQEISANVATSMTFYVSFGKSQLRKYIARIMSVLEEKYSGDKSIHDWREIFEGTLTEDFAEKTKTSGKSKLMELDRLRSNTYPEICIYYDPLRL